MPNIQPNVLGPGGLSGSGFCAEKNPDLKGTKWGYL